MKRTLALIEGLLTSIGRRTLPVHIRRWLRYKLQAWSGLSELQILTSGWERYAKKWQPDKPGAETRIGAGSSIRYLGDEWTAEIDTERGEHERYGLPLQVADNFEHDIKSHLLEPYLPPISTRGLEIGPGGGRLTALLLLITKELHVAEPSVTMLRYLKQRFANTANLHLHRTDGKSLPALDSASLDYIFAFDVFVHFEPRLIYWYLHQIKALLRPGGTGLIHYANVCTPLGWARFESDLEANLVGKKDYGSLGVMCPQLMVKFLEALQLEVVSDDVGMHPRDAIAVFRKAV